MILTGTRDGRWQGSNDVCLPLAGREYHYHFVRNVRMTALNGYIVLAEQYIYIL